MASRQNSSLTAKEKSSHSKPETKLKHDKSSSNSSTSTTTSVASSNSGGGGGVGGSSGGAAVNNVANKRKGASFQITSVSVSSTQHPHHMQYHHRNSTDNNGDDSADDLDDSHTDDNISRITDYETPSISETFSGEDVFFAQQNAAFGTAPVIPTSSQYGLAIVGPDLGGNGANLTDVHVSVTDAGINIMGPISSKQDPDHKNERFKVVKIESTEPFKRGRWMCMDYLDHTTLQAQDDGIDGASSNEDQITKDETTDETSTKLLTTMNNGEIEHVISDNEDLDHEVNKINSHQHHLSEASHQHPATMTSIQISNDFSNVNMQQQHNHVAQSMPQAQIETILTQEKLHHQHPEHQTISEQQNQHINPPTSQHAQTMTPEMIHASVMHQEQVTSHHQGVTLPTNLILQNIEQSQQLNSPNNNNNNNSSNVALPPPPASQQTTTITLNEHLLDHEVAKTNNAVVTNQFQNSQVGDSNRNESEIHQQQIIVGNVVSSESVSSPSSSAGLGTVADGVIVNSNNAIVSEVNESVSNNAGVNAAAATVGAESDGQALNEDNESASGTSAVAIDNKIEQAMDLVKSHLMFAVREEVEVLKEKIAELMDRINQLEVENSILKANASQETLSQLTTATVIISPQPPQQQTQQTASPVVPQVPTPQITQQPPQPTPATNQPTQQPVVTTQAAAQVTPNQQQQSTS